MSRGPVPRVRQGTRRDGAEAGSLREAAFPGRRPGTVREGELL